MKEIKTFEQLISENKNWHSWKCRCGGLNGKGNGNCGRCGGMRGEDSMYYGKDVIHGGIWNKDISLTPQTDKG